MPVIAGGDDDPALVKRPANFAALTPLDFLAWAAVTFRERTGVVYGRTRLTYGDLDVRCRRLASALRRRGVLSDDGVGVVRTPRIDVVDGRVQRRYHPHRQDEREILRCPILFRRRKHPDTLTSEYRAGFGASPEFHTVLHVLPCHRREEPPGDARVHKERFHGVTYAGPLHLGVEAHPLRYLEIRLGIDVRVAYPAPVGEDGYPRAAPDGGDHVLPAAWNDHIYVPVHRE